MKKPQIDFLIWLICKLTFIDLIAAALIVIRDDFKYKHIER
jgi:hypothetical protein